MRNLILALAIGLLSLSLNTGCASLQQYMGSSDDGGGMTTQKVVGGLYDALTVGSQRAVGSTSKKGGFLNNPLIKINMPSELEPIMNAVRKVGLSKQVDNLVAQMNHAAEQASGEAINILVDTVKGITFQDAWAILNGNETAATDYFRARTTDQLTARFSPIVDKKMHELGVYDIYNTINNAYAALPFGNNKGYNLEKYVVDEALRGLFTTVAEEEAKIRENLKFRSTPALKEVFGFLDSQRAQGKRAEPTSSSSGRTSSGSTRGQGGSLPKGTVQ